MPKLRAAGQSTMEQRARWTKFDAEWGYKSLPKDLKGEMTGWLIESKATTVTDSDRIEHAAVDLYFLKQDGSTFRGTLVH